MDMQIASMIATIVAVLCLIAMVYVALFMDRGGDEPPRKQHPKEHFQRWEDRL
jgi:hypothetical protein